VPQALAKSRRGRDYRVYSTIEIEQKRKKLSKISYHRMHVKELMRRQVSQESEYNIIWLSILCIEDLSPILSRRIPKSDYDT